MAMPQQHLVAFYSDFGISRATGTLVLSVLLGTAFASRQVWGVISDRLGGLKTIFISSGLQAVALSVFLFTQSETGLFLVAGAFGLGFGGSLPLTRWPSVTYSRPEKAIGVSRRSSLHGIRDGNRGMDRRVLYDVFGSYAAAFATGVAVNAIHFALIGGLVSRQSRAPTA